MPILAKQTGEKRTTEKMDGPKRENRLNVNVHTNSDVKVLWKITGDFDITKDICSCVIDCEVVDNWYENLDATKKFIDENKRRPSQRLEIEKKLSNWFYAQIHNYKKKLQAMKDEAKYDLWTLFLKEYKEYLKNDDEIWYESFDELKRFIGENNRKPIMKSSNQPEKVLGKWLSHQITNYNKREHGMKDEAKYDLWTKLLDEFREYFKSNDEIWYETFELVKKFIAENKKRPSEDSKNETEKKLGRWVSSQCKNYKNKLQGMKEEKRYNLWTGFLEEYRDYFKQDSGTQSISASSASTTPNPKSSPKKKSMKLSTQPISVPAETPDQRRLHTKTELSTLHQRYKTLTSQHLREEFTTNPTLWHKYHEISEANEESFPEEEIPRNRVIQELTKIKTKRTKQVVDMGCGRADIAKHFATDPRFQFTNYDHISSNGAVESCDIASTPLEDNSVEICILSLAMWGHNCRDYVKEAGRILESNGILYIIEPTKRWSEEDENKRLIPGKEGTKLKAILEENGFKIKNQSVNKFCLFECTR